jgi:hypothetical protein
MDEKILFYDREFSFLNRKVFCAFGILSFVNFYEFSLPHRTREPFYDIEFHSINLSSALLYCEEKLLFSQD